MFVTFILLHIESFFSVNCLPSISASVFHSKWREGCKWHAYQEDAIVISPVSAPALAALPGVTQREDAARCADSSRLNQFSAMGARKKEKDFSVVCAVMTGECLCGVAVQFLYYLFISVCFWQVKKVYATQYLEINLHASKKSAKYLHKIFPLQDFFLLGYSWKPNKVPGLWKIKSLLFGFEACIYCMQ